VFQAPEHRLRREQHALAVAEKTEQARVAGLAERHVAVRLDADAAELAGLIRGERKAALFTRHPRNESARRARARAHARRRRLCGGPLIAHGNNRSEVKMREARLIAVEQYHKVGLAVAVDIALELCVRAIGDEDQLAGVTIERAHERELLIAVACRIGI